MRKQSIYLKPLLALLLDKKVATKFEIQKSLGTNSRMTMFRKLSELKYITSYSHSGKYYSLIRIAKFNKYGIWSYHSIYFSKDGTLLKTIIKLIIESESGFTVSELGKLLKVKVGDSLLKLIRKNKVCRSKNCGVYVYYSKVPHLRKQQELLRHDNFDNYNVFKDSDVLMHEVKAALVLFFSSLNEQQKRLFAGFESMKHGFGGDKLISEIFKISAKTIAKGRNELLRGEILFENTRKSGGGRKTIQKKKSNRKN